MARGRDAGPTRAADVVPPVQDLRVHAVFGGRQLRQGPGIQQDALVLPGSLLQAGRIRAGLLKAHAPAAQGLPFGIQGRGPRPGQHGPAGQQLCFGIAFMEDGHGIALDGQIPGTDQTGQTGTDDGDALLFARHGQGTGLHAQMLRAEDLQPVQVDGAPQIAAQAGADNVPAVCGRRSSGLRRHGRGRRAHPDPADTGTGNGAGAPACSGTPLHAARSGCSWKCSWGPRDASGQGPRIVMPHEEAGNGYGTRHACGGQGRKNGAGQDGIPPAGCRQPCLHLTGDRRTGPPDSHCSIYFLGMAANTFSGYAGRWVTRAPQAL